MLRVASDHFSHSDTGRARRANEDAYFARAPVFVVADGMGGAQAGEVASRLAIEAFERGLSDGAGVSGEELLSERVQEANQRIHEMSQSAMERAGMGTTITAAHVGRVHRRRRPAGGGRLVARGLVALADLLEAKQHDGDVVAPARRVGGVDQRVAGVGQRARRAHDVRDLRLRDHRGQPVAAQHEDVARHPAPRARVDDDVGLGPQRAGDDRALGMLVGLLGGELAATAHLLDERVVLGQARELLAAQPVGARVADVGDRDVVLADVGGRDRRAHPGAAHRLLRHLVDALVGLLDAGGEQLLPADSGAVGQPTLEGLDGHARRDLARLRAAHPVGDDEDRRAREVRILVRTPDDGGEPIHGRPLVGQAGGDRLDGPRPLHQGDRIRIGDSTFQFEE